MPRRKVANPLALAVLSCLRQRPMHPYEMSLTMREQQHDSAVKLNFGSLYAVVEALAKAGFIVQIAETRQGGRPQRTVYEITEAGAAELHDWLRELLSEPAKEYHLLSAGLTFMTALPPTDAAHQLRLRVERLTEAIEQARAALHKIRGQSSKPTVARVFLVEDEYQLALREAELKYVRRLAQEIADGSIDGVADWAAIHSG
ncbi:MULTISPECIES: PadR family transcriptional regulator [unclassified Micromonospora]|uniref:PadR family transcriptional regulator n=1 Tax=unclassified Micromonospora TaxID=2617518 RepID=UPI003A8B8E5D